MLKLECAFLTCALLMVFSCWHLHIMCADRLIIPPSPLCAPVRHQAASQGREQMVPKWGWLWKVAGCAGRLAGEHSWSCGHSASSGDSEFTRHNTVLFSLCVECVASHGVLQMGLLRFGARHMYGSIWLTYGLVVLHISETVYAD